MPLRESSVSLSKYQGRSTDTKYYNSRVTLSLELQTHGRYKQTDRIPQIKYYNSH